MRDEIPGSASSSWELHFIVSALQSALDDVRAAGDITATDVMEAPGDAQGTSFIFIQAKE